jgi:cephalosporin hydroxylase
MPSTTTHAPTNPRLSGFQPAAAPPGLAAAVGGSPGSAAAAPTLRAAPPREAPARVLDRYDVFPHIEDRLTMTVREWLVYHWTMHRHFTKYLGLKVLKTPFDWIVLGDILQDTRPEVVVAIGCYEGGDTLWMAHLLDRLDYPCQIIGVDVNPTPLSIEHPRISWVIGDATDPQTAARVAEICAGRRGMVIEDSDHKYTVTREILKLYERFVAPDCYFIVEDTIVDYIQMPPFPGPMKAVDEFIAARRSQFVVDRSREKYIVTHNPKGYLLRVGENGAAR